MVITKHLTEVHLRTCKTFWWIFFCKKRLKVANFSSKKYPSLLFDRILNTTLCQGNMACIECEWLLLRNIFNWITDQTSKETLKKIMYFHYDLQKTIESQWKVFPFKSSELPGSSWKPKQFFKSNFLLPIL